MALFYKKYQDKKKGGNLKWYARPVYMGNVGLEALAEKIQRECTMTKADVYAVLTEAVAVMNDCLQNSLKVKLDGFGTFYLTLSTSGANAEEDFTSTANINRANSRFMIARKRVQGKYVRTFCETVTCKEWKYGEVVAEESAGA